MDGAMAPNPYYAASGSKRIGPYQTHSEERSLTHILYHRGLFADALHSYRVRTDGRDIYYGDLFS